MFWLFELHVSTFIRWTIHLSFRLYVRSAINDSFCHGCVHDVSRLTIHTHYVAPSVGRLVPSLYYQRFWAFWAHCSCLGALVIFSITAPAHAHASGVPLYPPFLGATKHLYNWLCPSLCRSVGLSGNAFVRRFTRRTLLALFAFMALFSCSELTNSVSVSQWALIGYEFKKIPDDNGLYY